MERRRSSVRSIDSTLECIQEHIDITESSGIGECSRPTVSSTGTQSRGGADVNSQRSDGHRERCAGNSDAAVMDNKVTVKGGGDCSGVTNEQSSGRVTNDQSVAFPVRVYNVDCELVPAIA